MAENNVGVAMYTLYKEMNKDIFEAFETVKNYGIRHIEMYGMLEISPEIIRNAARKNGITITGWHLPWEAFQIDRIDDTIAFLKSVNCDTAVLQCLGGKWECGHKVSEECKEVWLEYIDKINEFYPKLKENGISLAYHNHEHEFTLVYDGKTVFDILYEGLSPEIIMELDTGNAVEGGYEPCEIIKKYPDRAIILHLKPYSHKEGFNTRLGAEDDENRLKEYMAIRRYKYMLIESENTKNNEKTNLSECIEGLRQNGII